MACILVFLLHKSEAYSSMQREIVVLRVQSKRMTSKAAMQWLHDVWQNFVIFFRVFRQAAQSTSYFLRRPSLSASAKCTVASPPDAGNPLADVLFSC
jgi:hypothetical protein